MAIFNIFADLYQQQPLYIEPFIELLKNCSKPFLLDKSTDAEIYSSALLAFYSDFGREHSFLNIKESILIQDIFFVYQIKIFNDVFLIHCINQFN
jgi:hypothetical protein